MVVDDEVEQVYVSTQNPGSGVATLLLTEAERLVGAARWQGTHARLLPHTREPPRVWVTTPPMVVAWSKVGLDVGDGNDHGKQQHD